MDYLGIVTGFDVVAKDDGNLKHIEYSVRLIPSGRIIKKRSKTTALPKDTYLRFPTERIEDLLGRKNIILSWVDFWQELLDNYIEVTSTDIVKEIESLTARPEYFTGNPRFDFLDVVTLKNVPKDNIQSLFKSSIIYSQETKTNPFVLALLDGVNDEDILSTKYTQLQKFAEIVLPIQLVEQGSFFSVYSACERLNLDTSFLNPFIVDVLHNFVNGEKEYPKLRDVWAYIDMDILSLVKKKYPNDLDGVFSICPQNWEEWLYKDKKREKKYKDRFYSKNKNIDKEKKDKYFSEKTAKESAKIEKRDKIVSDFLMLLKSTFTFDLEVSLDGKYIKEYSYKISGMEPDEEKAKFDRELYPQEWKKFENAYNKQVINNIEPCIIIGHNIRKHDFKYLEQKKCPIYLSARLCDNSIVSEHIWDTLEVELLTSFHDCYKLNTSHIAKEDVILTEQLFLYQVKRLIENPSLYRFIKGKKILPVIFEKRFDDILSNHLLDNYDIKNFLYHAIHQYSFFYSSPSKDEHICDAVKSFLSGDDRKLIIAPKYYWPTIAAIDKNIYFLKEDSQYCFNIYSPFNRTKVLDFRPKIDNARYYVYEFALKKHVLERDITCFALLPDIIKETITEIENDNGINMTQLIEEKDLSSILFFCAEPSDATFAIRKLSADEIHIEKTCLVGNYNNPILQTSIGKIETQQLPFDQNNEDSIIVAKSPDGCLEWYEKNIHSSYYHYRTIDRQFDESILKLCSTPIEHTQIEYVKLPCSRITCSNYKFSRDLPIERFTDTAPFHRQYWALQYKLFMAHQATFPKVLLLSSRREFEDAKHFFEKLKSGIGEPKYRFHNKLNRRLEIIQKGAFYTIVSIDEILDCDFSINKSFSFFLNSLNIERSLKLGWDVEQMMPQTLSTLLRVLDSFTGTNDSELIVIDPYIQNSNISQLCNKPFKHILGCKEYSVLLEKCKSYDYNNPFDIDTRNVKKFANTVLLGGGVCEKEREGKEESGLYPYQTEAIDKFCSNNGESTYLSIVPTGGGKSLIYQSLVLYRLIEKEKKKSSHSLTLVITPLQALMKDQYKEICEMAPKYKEYFAYLNSDTNEKTKASIYERLNTGQLSLLFIAPERLRYTSFTSCLEKALKRKGVNSIIFDEAHCITEWGLDFRPDYQFAAKKLVSYKIQYPFLRYMLLSATVSQTTRKELESIFGDIPEENITRSEDKTIPIKKVIKPSFLNLGTISEKKERFSAKIAQVYKLIFENDLFNAQRLISTEKHNNISWSPASKIIIFTQSQLDAENGVLELTSLIEDKLVELQKKCPDSQMISILSQLVGKIDFYHAGLKKNQKNDKYLRFKKEDLEKYNDDLKKEGKEEEEIISGEPIIILFATKAFGMGMNIKNIHMVIHFSPSMYIEDYLQEVGRACRDEALLKFISGKYNNPNSTQAYCLYTSNDLDKIKEHLNQEMQWPDLSETYSDIKRYIRENYGAEADTKKEYLIPLNLLQYRINDSGDSEEHLLKNLNWYETPIWKKKERLITSAKCSSHYEIELISKNEPPALNKDLSFVYNFIKNHPSQERMKRACFEYNDILKCPNCPDSIKSVKDFDRVIRQGIQAKLFKISYVCLQVLKNESNIREIHRHINDNQPLCALAILTELANKEIINEEIIEQFFNNKAWRPSYIKFLKDTIKYDIVDLFKNAASDNRLSVDKYSEMCQLIIRTIATAEHQRISFPELFAGFTEQSSNTKEELIMSCVIFCIHLHYIDLSPFSYDCITVNFKNIKDIDSHTPPHAGSDDLNAYELFERRYSIKEHKVQAMRALCEADGTDRLKLIQNYIDNVQDWDSLKAYLGDEQCKKISKELLNDIIKGTNEEFSLSPAQKEIYDIPEEKNICVKAGAGSGKTRVLVCRVLKYLVDLRCANEDEVLVLAYNNKVKDELRKRIYDITRKVSFPFTGDNIMTFHSFAGKYCPTIKESYIPINNWERELLSFLKNDKNALSRKYKYILVDEFQDVTETRLSILKELSERKAKNGEDMAKLFVVGDAFQSIYGYDKKANGDDPNPLHYFKKFKADYEPETPTLLENHRSYQEIIDIAHQYIKCLDPTNEHRLSQFGRVEGESHPDSIAEIGPDWKERFNEIRERFQNLQQDNTDASMAILFRNNAEVIDANGWICQNYPELKGKMDVRKTPLFYNRLREYSIYRAQLSKLDTVNDESIKSIRESILKDHPNYCENFLEIFEDIALNSFQQNKDKDSSELCQLFQEIVEEKSYEIEEKSSKELTIATIHSVKGLDFDLVVIPETHSQIQKDEIDEERRLMYVGCTRAKKLLYYPMGKREKSIIAGEEYEEPQAGPAIYCDPRPCKVHMDYLCQDPDKIQYINDNVSVGDPIVIRNRIIYHNNIAIGRLIYHSPIERAMIRENLDEKAGFHITAVYKKTRTETEYLDEIRGTTYANSWAPNIDYLFYIDFELDEP